MSAQANVDGTVPLATQVTRERFQATALTAVFVLAAGLSLLTSSSFSAEQTNLTVYLVAAAPFLMTAAFLGAVGRLRLRGLLLADYMVAASLLFGGLGGLTGPEPGTNIRYLVGSFGAWLVFRVVFDSLVRRPESLDTIVRWLVYSVGVFGVFAILRRAQFAVTDPVAFANKLIVADISSNMVGGLFVLGGVGAVYEYLRGAGWRALFAAAIALGTVVAGLSRGAALALIGGVVMLVALDRFCGERSSTGRGAWLVAMGVVAVPVVTSVAIWAIGMDVPAVWNYVSRGLVGRDLVWQVVIEYWRERPLVGWGLASSSAVIGSDIPAYYFGASAHSSWFRMLLETGILGASAYVLGLVALFVSLWRSEASEPLAKRRRNLATTWLAAFIILQTFDTYLLFALSFRNLMYTLAFLAAWELAYMSRPRAAGSRSLGSSTV